jgi:hypothetical protein
VVGAKNDTITKPPNSPSSTPLHTFGPHSSRPSARYISSRLKPEESPLPIRTLGVKAVQQPLHHLFPQEPTRDHLQQVNRPSRTRFWILSCGVKLLDTRFYHPSCQTSLSATTRSEPGPCPFSAEPAGVVRQSWTYCLIRFRLLFCLALVPFLYSRGVCLLVNYLWVFLACPGAYAEVHIFLGVPLHLGV